MTAGLELAGKVGIILEAYAVCDFAHAFLCDSEQLTGPFDPIVQQIIQGRESNIPLEHFVEVGPVDVRKIGNILYADLIKIVMIDIIEALLKVWRIFVLFQGIGLYVLKK